MAEDSKEEVKIVEKAPSPKIKPELEPSTKRAFELRKEKKDKQPKFRRQEWFRYKRLGTSWRKARGNRSKVRRGKVYRPKKVKVGFRGPIGARNLHPSGFKEVMIANPSQLDKVDPKKEAARIVGTVGDRKRELIVERADEMGIKVLNRGDY